MKKLVACICFITLLISAVPAHALTPEDVELLILLGVVDEDKIETVRNLVATQTFTDKRGNTEVVTAPSACLNLTGNFIVGNSGNDVTRLQQFLRTEGHFTHPENTGYYGPATRDAVAQFQLAAGLITSTTQIGAGSVGPLTREKIKEMSCPEIELEPEPPIIVDVNAGLVYEDREDGIHRVEFQYEINDDKDLDEWRLTLVCAADEVSIETGSFEECNTVEMENGNRDKRTFRLKFQNETDYVQSVGLRVEALDTDDKVIAVNEVITNLRVPSNREEIPFIRLTSDFPTGDPNINNPDPRDKNGCLIIPENDVAARWSAVSNDTHPKTGRSIEVFAMPGNVSNSPRNSFVIVQPGNRTLAEIYDAYKDDYIFPGIEYVDYMDDLGDQYYNSVKQTSVRSRRTNFLPRNEYENPNILESKRRGIQGIVPAIPAMYTTRERDFILALGEVYKESNRSTDSFEADGFIWNWHGREFGIFLDKYYTYNGSFSVSSPSFSRLSLIHI